MDRLIASAAWTTATAVLVACGAPGAPLEVVDARAPAPAGAVDVMSVYFVIANHQAVPDTLRAAHLEGATSMEIHRSVIHGTGMEMERVPTVVVPARSEFRLEPGVVHGMATGLTRTVAPGDTLRLTLEFARAGTVTVAVPVVTYAEITG